MLLCCSDTEISDLYEESSDDQASELPSDMRDMSVGKAALVKSEVCKNIHFQYWYRLSQLYRRRRAQTTLS